MSNPSKPEPIDRGMRAADTSDVIVSADEEYESTAQAGDRHLLTNRANAVAEDEAIVVPVHEEELVATKREREAGEVTIRKDVVEEKRTLEVPVTEEQVRVTRRPVDREATAGEVAFEGGTIEVPLTTEEVQLQRQVRVSEEIEIDKEAVQTSQSVTGTVRKEIVDVDDATAVETGSRTVSTSDTRGSAS